MMFPREVMIDNHNDLSWLFLHQKMEIQFQHLITTKKLLGLLNIALGNIVSYILYIRKV